MLIYLNGIYIYIPCHFGFIPFSSGSSLGWLGQIAGVGPFSPMGGGPFQFFIKFKTKNMCVYYSMKKLNRVKTFFFGLRWVVLIKILEVSHFGL